MYASIVASRLLSHCCLHHAVTMYAVSSATCITVANLLVISFHGCLISGLSKSAFNCVYMTLEINCSIF